MAWKPPIGIPTPYWEGIGPSGETLNPIDLEIPAFPSPWTSDVNGFVFVRKGGTSTSNGNPTNPRGEIPTGNEQVAFGAGALMIVVDADSSNPGWTFDSPENNFFVDNYNSNTFRITAGAPDKLIWIVPYNPAKPPRMSGGFAFGGTSLWPKYVIIDGIKWKSDYGPYANTTGTVVNGSSHHIMYRNCLIHGNAGDSSITGDRYSIDNPGGYSAGTTTIHVDGGTGTCPAGTWVQIGGANQAWLKVATGLTPEVEGNIVLEAPGLLVPVADDATVLIYTGGNGSLSGSGGGFSWEAPCEEVIFHNCVITKGGTWDYHDTPIYDGIWHPGEEADKDAHGVSFVGFCHNWWVVDSEISYMSGNAMQAGGGSIDSNPDNGISRHCYVGRCHVHHTRQTGLGTKRTQDLIWSENICHDFFRNSPYTTPNSGGIGGQYGPRDSWVLFNTIHTAQSGVGFASGTGGIGGSTDTAFHVIGNVIYNIHDEYRLIEDWRTWSSNGYGVGTLHRGYDDMNFIDNTFDDYDAGVMAPSQVATLSGNIFSRRNPDVAGVDLLFEFDDGMIINNNVIQEINETDDGTSDFVCYVRVIYDNYTTVAALNSARSVSNIAITSPPAYTDPTAAPESRDYSLTASLDARTGAHAAYDRFQAMYGRSIKFDRAGKLRPASGAWDAGAYEYGGATPTVAAPVNTTAPSVMGTIDPAILTVGSIVMPDHGIWTGYPQPSYVYQWVRYDADGVSNPTDIPGATDLRYQVSPLLYGYTLAVRMTARNEAGVSTVTSARTPLIVASVPTCTSGPMLITASGNTAQVSIPVSALTRIGLWQGYPELEFSYQWSRYNPALPTDGPNLDGWVELSGETNSFYIPPVGDYRNSAPGNDGIWIRYRCAVTGSDGTPANDLTVDSNEIYLQYNAPAFWAPINSIAPTIIGSREVGSELSLYSTGTWSAAPAISTWSYQWMRGGVAIDGAIASTYDLVEADAGYSITLRLGAQNNQPGIGYGTSNAIGPVYIPPTAPTITPGPSGRHLTPITPN